MQVYRLFIIWARNVFIIIPPVMMSTGDLGEPLVSTSWVWILKQKDAVCGIAVAYIFSRADEPYYVVAKPWITALYAVSVA